MSPRVSIRAAIAFGVLLALSGCGSGGGESDPGAGPAGSSPALGIIEGYIIDDAGKPVEGARVSVYGIEAEALTGPDGFYRVRDESLVASSGMVLAGVSAASASQVEIAVLAPGMEPRVASLEVTEGDLASVDLVASGLEPELTLTRPQDYKVFLVPSSCSSPAVPLEGFARLGSRPSYRLDVALLMDMSGSTRKDALDVDGDGVVDSVLDAEISAARCFLEGLDERTTRVCLMTFNDAVTVLHDFSSDFDALSASLDGVTAGGGTNFDAAFQVARDVLEVRKLSDDAEDVPDEEPAIKKPSPFQAVVLLSDGIATSHGIPRVKSDSNLTQSRADRETAIASATSLGEATSAQLFAYSFLPLGDTNKKRTTLPHCVAACGGGKYAEIADIGSLSSALCGEPLTALLEVEITNLTTGVGPLRPALSPDGFFSETVPVSLVGPAGGKNTVKNEVEVKLTAHLGSKVETVKKTVNVKLMSKAKYDSLDAGDVLAAQTAQKPVSKLKELKSPLGKPLKDDLLYNLLVGSEKAEFEDAIELLGVETFGAGESAEDTVTLKVDFVFKDACYQSDVGYIVMDPAHVPANAVEALAGAQVLCNTWQFGQPDCSAQSIPAGQASFEFSVPSGSRVAFFLVPNQQLAQYMADPKAAPAQPLFTLHRLNPAGFQQNMCFRSLAGRTEPGASKLVVTPGPLVLFAFEDVSTAVRTTDQDFNDLVFTVATVAGSQPEETPCAD